MQWCGGRIAYELITGPIARGTMKSSCYHCQRWTMPPFVSASPKLKPMASARSGMTGLATRSGRERAPSFTRQRANRTLPRRRVSRRAMWSAARYSFPKVKMSVSKWVISVKESTNKSWDCNRSWFRERSNENTARHAERGDISQVQKLLLLRITHQQKSQQRQFDAATGQLDSILSKRLPIRKSLWKYQRRRVLSGAFFVQNRQGKMKSMSSSKFVYPTR